MTDATHDEVLAFIHFTREHLRKFRSINPLERINKEIKRRTNEVGIFLNVAAITQLVGNKLLGQQ